MNGKGDVLYLAGTTPSVRRRGWKLHGPILARSIVSRMRKADGKLPRYYQILLAVKSMDDTPIGISYFMHKELAEPVR